jgi:nucleoside phosphorylase
MDYCENHKIKIDRLKGRIDTVIITATDLETELLHLRLKPIHGYDKIIKIYCEKTAYFIGVFGDYTICHTQCAAKGSTQPGSSSVTTFQVISHWNPRVLMMIGIAFGVDKEKQTIGDILVAESINGYDHVKVVQGKRIPRGTTLIATDNLTRRIKEIAKGWNCLSGKKKLKVHTGEILSGDALINDRKFRDELINSFPKSTGGEMEGVGFYSAAQEKNIPHLLLKSICDYADGNKDVLKDRYQAKAMNCLLGFCTIIFQSNFLSELYQTKSYKANLKLIDSIVLENILFNSYEINKEPYFLERSLDKSLIKELMNSNYWIHGVSGVGKTTSLSRGLKRNGTSYIIINLANSSNKPLPEILRNVYYEIASVFNVERQIPPAGYDIKAIDKLIKENSKGKRYHFLIEEIPIDSDQDSSEFVNEMISWVILNYSDSPPYYLYFSSLFDPTQHIKDYQSKALQILKIKEFKIWDRNECRDLIQLINEGLKIELNNDQIDLLITETKGIPRFTKAFYKNYMTKDTLTAVTFSDTINETKRDLKW